MCNEEEKLFERLDSDEFAADLRGVLRPAPLPNRLVRRIRADWDQRSVTHAGRWTPTLNFIGLAAAACLTLALLSPTADDRANSGGDLALSSGDAAKIVAAYGVLSWDGSADYSLNAVDASLDRLQQNLSREANAGGLPWNADDDWDAPPTNDNESSRGVAPFDAWRARYTSRAEMRPPRGAAPPATKEV